MVGCCGGAGFIEANSGAILSSTHFLYRWAVDMIGVDGRLLFGEKTSAEGLRDAGVDGRESPRLSSESLRPDELKDSIEGAEEPKESADGVIRPERCNYYLITQELFN